MEKGGSNNKARGSFVVLEGTDGSGKGTQLQLLAGQLRNAGHDVAVFDFPQYNAASSYFVKRYLNGEYGSVDQVGPYTGALFYALDRYDIADKIVHAVNEGKVVLANRYTASNMAHQGAKFDNAEQRRGYFIWLDNLEFETLKIPRPDLNIVLRVPADIAQKLVDQKDPRSYTDQKRDLHEADLDHLELAVSVYDDLCQLFPKDFARIDCVRSGELLNIETINKLVREKVAPLLPEPTPKPTPALEPRESAGAIDLPPIHTSATTTKPTALSTSTPVTKTDTYYIPASLDKQTAELYRNGIDTLRAKHANLLNKLIQYLEQQGPADANNDLGARAATIARAVLPVASIGGVVVAPHNPTAKRLLDKLSSGSYAEPVHEQTTLIQATPRNELDIVPQLLYAQANVPFRDLSLLTENWNYEQRSEILNLFLSNIPNPNDADATSPLDLVTYSWDMVSEYSLFYDLLLYSTGRTQSIQTLTPRLGFEVPRIIEDVDLTDEYEDCFDLSLQLYSRLQSNGFENEAQYVTLQGHKLRWHVSYSAREMPAIIAHLQSMKDQPTAVDLAKVMHDKISETHPLISERLDLTTPNS